MMITKMKQGGSYIVTGFSLNCPDGYMHKLLALGFVPGSQFMIKQIAPLGSPYLIIIDNFSLYVRKDDLAFIKVKPI